MKTVRRVRYNGLDRFIRLLLDPIKAVRVKERSRTDVDGMTPFL